MSKSKNPLSDLKFPRESASINNKAYISNFQYSGLGMFMIHRFIKNRDFKIIITSSGSTTGTGKTTLAILLCRMGVKYSNEIFENNKEWRGKEHSFVDLYDYLKAYDNNKKGSMLLLDEVENSADKRQHMSHQNLALSQAWAILRYRNIGSIATLPTVTMLDSRLMELADIWINVIYPGKCNVYYLTVNDFTKELEYKRLKINGLRETLRWPKIPKDDSDFQYLKDQKKELGIPGLGESVDEQDVKDAKKNVEKHVTKKLIKMKKDYHNMTQDEIADAVNKSQQYVSKAKKEMKKEGEL